MLKATDKPKCPECGKEFQYPSFLKKHLAGCRKGTKKSSRPRGSVHGGAGGSSPFILGPGTAVPQGSNGSLVANALAILRERRMKIIDGIPEIKRIDAAILALEPLVLGGDQATERPSGR